MPCAGGFVCRVPHLSFQQLAGHQNMPTCVNVLTSSAIPSVQWDIVKSVVKSVAGLQGRKFKVRSTHLATGNGSLRLENGGCRVRSKQQA